MTKLRTYLALDTTFSHTAVYFIRAKSIDHAISTYCQQFVPLRRFKNGRWQWGNEYYDNANELLASTVDISFEIGLLTPSGNSACEEVFAGIDWWGLYFRWDDKDFYMKARKKVGKFYEWYSPHREYYVLFPSPAYIRKRIRRFVGPSRASGFSHRTSQRS